MASKTEIVNLALIHLAVGKEISNIETEQSTEAKTARQIYNICLDKVLSDFEWPFATKIVALSLVEEQPNTEWWYSYRYPTDCLFFRRILSGERTDSRQTRAPYRIASDSQGTLIFADMQDAEAEYTVRVENAAIYPADFQMAFSLLMGGMMAPKLTGGDQFKLGIRCLQLYDDAIRKAQSRAANEEQPDITPESEFIRERG